MSMHYESPTLGFRITFCSGIDSMFPNLSRPGHITGLHSQIIKTDNTRLSVVIGAGINYSEGSSAADLETPAPRLRAL
jgi:hypothetical protein